MTVDLGQSLRIPCPARGTSYGAVFSWYGTVNVEFKRNSRRAILPAGDMFIMFVTDEDISKTEELNGIKCTMTGANTIYRSGPITLKKRRPGNNLLYYILYCITVDQYQKTSWRQFIDICSCSRPRIYTNNRDRKTSCRERV